MNGELALLAALAAIGGRWLRGSESQLAPGLISRNSTFRYVGRFSAELPPRGLLGRRVTATSPEQWLGALRSRRFTGLSLITDVRVAGLLPAYRASSFANSGTWALVATGPKNSTMWTIVWETGRTIPPSGIWSIIATGAPIEHRPATHIDAVQARDRMRSALGDIRAFADRTDETRAWTEWFEKSAPLLDEAHPVAPYHPDLLPLDASLERRQLAAAAVQAWVFGGMGSWNDTVFADPSDARAYERVGANLYAGCLGALAAAVNDA